MTHFTGSPLTTTQVADLKSVPKNETIHVSQAARTSLAALWAQKYVTAVKSSQHTIRKTVSETAVEIGSYEGRSATAKKLQKNLTMASAKAWALTEELLSVQIERHGIDPRAIDPWQIAADSHKLFEQTLTAYAEGVTPSRLSVLIAGEFGQMRRKYTADDPRAIGFVSMQFHYTGKVLLEGLSVLERSLVVPYFKVMDDHLYMPLREAYEAAANHDEDSPALRAVQQLLPNTTAVAHAICTQIQRLYPDYQTHSGLLNSTTVRVSSVRDAEMFQVYLGLCALQGSLASVQQELFPLCVMLYPRLRVSWKLVQEMLQMLGWELHDRLSAEHLAIFLPYLQALIDMFSNDVVSALDEAQ